VRQAQHVPAQPAMGTEFVPTVASHTSQDERVAATACDFRESKVAELVRQNDVRPLPA